MQATINTTIKATRPKSLKSSKMYAKTLATMLPNDINTDSTVAQHKTLTEEHLHLNIQYFNDLLNGCWNIAETNALIIA